MKKMTVTIITLLLIVGLHTSATARDHQSGAYQSKRGHGASIQVVAAPIQVGHNRAGKWKKQRRCFPASMKTRINSQQPVTVQITVCKKRGSWVASPLYINVGRQNVAHNPVRWERPHPMYEPMPYPGGPVFPGFIR